MNPREQYFFQLSPDRLGDQIKQILERLADPGLIDEHNRAVDEGFLECAREIYEKKTGEAYVPVVDRAAV